MIVLVKVKVKVKVRRRVRNLWWGDKSGREEKGLNLVPAPPGSWPASESEKDKEDKGGYALRDEVREREPQQP